MATVPVYRPTIDSSWIDYNGHLRDAYYGLIVSYAIDDFMDHVGLDAAYRERTACTIYTLELHMHYLHEVKSTDLLSVETSVLDADQKRIHVGCLFACPRVGGPVASADVMLLHVQQGQTVASAAFPADIAATLQSLALAPEAAAAWGPASRKIAIKRR
jgi:acyl-CoA thioester hydrolase